MAVEDAPGVPALLLAPGGAHPAVADLLAAAEKREPPGVVKAARELRAYALERGWRAFVDGGEDTAGHAYFTLYLTSGERPGDDYQEFRLTWHTRPTNGGSYRLFSMLYRRTHQRWQEPSSLKAVRAIIDGEPGKARPKGWKGRWSS